MNKEKEEKRGRDFWLLPTFLLVGVMSCGLYVNQELLFADTKANQIAQYVEAQTGDAFDVRQINNQERIWALKPSSIQLVFDGEKMENAVKVDVPATLNKKDKVQVLANYVLRAEAEKAENETGFAVGTILKTDTLKWNEYEDFENQLASVHHGKKPDSIVTTPVLSFSNLDGKLVLSKAELKGLEAYYNKAEYGKRGIHILSYRETPEVYESIRFDGHMWQVIDKIAKGQSSN